MPECTHFTMHCLCLYSSNQAIVPLLCVQCARHPKHPQENYFICAMGASVQPKPNNTNRTQLFVYFTPIHSHCVYVLWIAMRPKTYFWIWPVVLFFLLPFFFTLFLFCFSFQQWSNDIKCVNGGVICTVFECNLRDVNGANGKGSRIYLDSLSPSDVYLS